MRSFRSGALKNWEHLGTRIRSESDRFWAGHVGRLVDWCLLVHLRLGLPIKDAPWQDDALVHMAGRDDPS